jgi:Tfp pilus assembly protein PilN
MTQVNLLPSDVRERLRTRRLMAAVIAGVGAVMALLFFVFVLQSARLSNTEQKLRAQEAVNSDLQAKIGQLQQFQQLKLTVAAREALAAAALNGQVAWSGVLRDISIVIPNKMWLTGMNGALTSSTAAPLTPSGTPTTGGAPAPVAPTLVGSIQFQGMASDFPTVAKWLNRLEQVNGWVNSWASNALRQSGDVLQANADKVQFTASVDLTTEATVQGSKK